MAAAGGNVSLGEMAMAMDEMTRDVAASVTAFTEALATLRTRLAWAGSGFGAVAAGTGSESPVSAALRSLAAMHREDVSALDGLLAGHRRDGTDDLFVFNIRGLLALLGDEALAPVVEGERGLLDAYDTVLAACDAPPGPSHALVAAQRRRLSAAVDRLAGRAD